MLNLMLIEDSEVDTLIFKKLLNILDVQINLIEFDSALQALDYLKYSLDNIIPDIILLDIHMPLMNGFEFLEEIEIMQSKIVSYSDIYILSASDSSEMRVTKDKFSYIKKFITKPIAMEDLNNFIVNINGY